MGGDIMNGHNLDFDAHYPVITDWDDLKNCPFSHKCWVNPSNVNEEKSYEKGDFYGYTVTMIYVGVMLNLDMIVVKSVPII